jgi:hypothetical protein
LLNRSLVEAPPIAPSIHGMVWQPEKAESGSGSTLAA